MTSLSKADNYPNRYRLKRTCKACDRLIPDANKSGFCIEHYDQHGANNPNYGRVYSKEERSAISEASKRNWEKNEYREKVIKAVSKPRREGFKEEQSKRITQWYKDNPEQRKIRSESMAKSWKEERISPNAGTFSCNESNLELQFFSMLNEVCDIEKTTLYNEDGKWFFPDVVAEREGTIIEFFGDYWHANPSRYNADDLIKGNVAQKIWDRDETRAQLLGDMGYLVMVVWESDFKADKEGTVLRISNYLNWESCSF